jgi:WD40 repeat protein
MLTRPLGRRLVAAGLVLAALAVSRPAFSAGDGPDEKTAEAALKRLRDRPAGPSADRARLRQELLAFRLSYPGTRAAVGAAGLLSGLPSPLDRLDAKTIPALERFDWQPKELVGVLGEPRGRHGGAVTSVAFSPDSSLVASAGTEYVRLWNTSNMRLFALLGYSTAISTVAFSKDGKFLAAGTSYGGVAVWDLAKGQQPRQRFTLAAATSPIYGIAFHPGSKILGAACFDHVVRLWDVSGKEMKDLGQVTGHKQPVLALAFSPDGKLLATGSQDGTARLFDMTSTDYKERSRLEGHTGHVQSVAFTPRGSTLATGCADGSIRLWATPAGPRPRPRIVFQGPKGAVSSLSFSSSGQTLAATCGDGTVRLWGLTGGKVRERHKLDGHAGVCSAVAYSPDMKLLASAGSDWMIRTWDLTKPKVPERFVPWSHLSYVYSVAFSPDGGTLASGSYDRVVRFWDLNRPEPRTRNYLKGDSVPVYCVAYSPDGKLVAAGGQHTTVRQWDAATGKTRPSLTNHPSHVNQIVYSPDGKKVATASGKLARVFDSSRGSALFTVSHETLVHCVNFSPDGRRLASGSGYYLYDKDGKIVVKDGKIIYTDCVLRFTDAESGTLVTAPRDAETPWYSVTWSADGREVLTGNYEPVLKRWRMGPKGLEALPPWKAGSGYCHRALPTPDGKLLVTTGLDSRLSVWEMSSGKRLRDWVFHEQMAGLAVSNDSRHLAVGLRTGVIYVLRLAPASGGKGG